MLSYIQNIIQTYQNKDGYYTLLLCIPLLDIQHLRTRPIVFSLVSQAVILLHIPPNIHHIAIHSIHSRLHDIDNMKHVFILSSLDTDYIEL